MPDVRFADPRLLGGNLGSLVPAFAQGFELGESIRMAPMRRQLADIQLQEAQNRLAMAPLEQQLAALGLGEAERRLAIPELIPGDITIEDTTREYPAAIDESGERTGPSEVVPGDLVQVQQFREYGRDGSVIPRTVRTTLKTAAQREADQLRLEADLEAKRALANQRSRGKEYEFTQLTDLYNNALAEQDAEAAALYKARLDRLTSRPGFLPTGTTYQRQVEKLAAEAGVTLERALKLAETAEGMEMLTKAANAAKSEARLGFSPPVTAAERQLLRGADELEREVMPALVAPPSFNSVAEAEAAASRGLIRPGQRIMVGGRSATWQE